MYSGAQTYPVASIMPHSSLSVEPVRLARYRSSPHRANAHFASCASVPSDKTGDDRWYEKNLPRADRIYDHYLAKVEEENNAKDDKIQ